MNIDRSPLLEENNNFPSFSQTSILTLGDENGALSTLFCMNIAANTTTREGGEWNAKTWDICEVIKR